MNKDSKVPLIPPISDFLRFTQPIFFQLAKICLLCQLQGKDCRLQQLRTSLIGEESKKGGGRDQGTALSQSMERLSCYRNDENPFPLRSKASRNPDGMESAPMIAFYGMWQPLLQKQLEDSTNCVEIYFIFSLSISAWFSSAARCAKSQTSAVTLYTSSRCCCQTLMTVKGTFETTVQNYKNSISHLASNFRREKRLCSKQA